MSDSGGEGGRQGDRVTVSGGDELLRRQAGVGLRAVWISLLTLVSRLLGLAREILAASLFGNANPFYDAFLFAWRVPNLFRRFLGEGALSTSLQATLTAADASAGAAHGRAIFLATIRLLTFVLVGLCALLMCALVAFSGALAPYLGVEPQATLELLLRLMPFVVLVCLAAAAGGALQVRGHYTAPALGPVLLNLGWIAALVWIGARVVGLEDDLLQLERVRWLSLGVLAASLLQFAVLIPALKRQGLWSLGAALWKPAQKARAAAWQVLRQSAPLAFGAAVYQVNVMIDGVMAQSLLEPGGQTAHYLANRVQQFPLALIAIAATTAVFPTLAALGHERRLGELRRLHDQTQRGVLFVALPAAIGLAVLAQPIASVLFEHGEFGAPGVARISLALRALSLAVISAGAVGLVVRTYYAMGDYKTPVRISALMLVCNAALNLFFLRGLGMDVEGLALATTLASFGNLFLLLPGLSRRLRLPRSEAGFLRAFGLSLLAAGASGLAAGGAEFFTRDQLPRALSLALALSAGAGVYFALAASLKIPEAQLMRERLARFLAPKRPT